MKTLKNLFSVSFLVAFLAGALFAQQQGAQTLNTTTLSAAISSTKATQIQVTSATNVLNTVSAQTTIWVDTEAMDVVSGTSTTGGFLTVTRGTHGTKAETHSSGRIVYVGRPNLFQGYDVAGTCTSGSGLAYVTPWINLTDGNVYQCYSDGQWFLSNHGSSAGFAIGDGASFCTGTVGTAETEFLNGAACSGATTSTFRYLVTSAGELANLQVSSSANVTGGTSKDVLTVFKNGSATAITCTIAAAAKTCTDSTHAVAVAAGDAITFQFVTATSDTAANMSATAGIYTQ